MKNWEKLKAGYWLDKFWIYLLHVRDNVSASFHNPSFIPVITLILGLALVVYILRKIYLIRRSLTENSILLELTPPSFTEKSAYTTQQLLSVIHDLGKQRSFTDKVLGRKNIFSFEIASTLNQGIRYLIRTTPKEVNNLKRNLLSYLPQVSVKIVNEYLPQNIGKLDKFQTKIVEFKLKHHFAYPLQRQDSLKEHDPVAYITGMMTKLSPGELISFQIVLSPTQVRQTQTLSKMILHNEDVLSYLAKPQFPQVIKIPFYIFMLLAKLVTVILNQLGWAVGELMSGGRRTPAYVYQNYNSQMQIQQHIKPARMLTTFEQNTVTSIQQKIDQSLFETSIRLLVVVKDKSELKERIRGFSSSLAIFSVPKYQSLNKKYNFPPILIDKIRLVNFKKRLLSLINNQSSSLLSISEVSDLYHFPFSRVAQTENIIKTYSKELPAPISLKKGEKLSVVFGKNTYGGQTTDIGLTEEKRKTHMFILGRTGSGKTTLMFSIAKGDIESGKGLAFIDPHGDVAEDLLAIVPISRKDDLIYVNPIDLKKPIHINLLELTPGLDEDDAELEKEVICEGVISLFKHVFSKDENTNAHRIEHILRNTIYTAFTVKDCTLFTINKILTDPKVRKAAIKNLDDEDLINFWKYEFGKAGDYQVVKMTQGVTAKVGRFLRSPTARRMLEHPKSTINFDDIINLGKILICNFSQGKLGEDTAKLFGTTILTKLQQAALKRAYIPEHKRKVFYLYVDEFQNFATQSFTKMVVQNRKFNMPLIIAEQSTAQQNDRNITNVILANVTTMICFRTGSFLDEQLMLDQFSPYLEKGEIPNLPRYRFYIKVSAIDSEEPFSGETIKIDLKKDQKKIDLLVKTSRDNWGRDYVKPKPFKNTQSSEDNEDELDKDKKYGKNTVSKKLLPDEEED